MMEILYTGLGLVVASSVLTFFIIRQKRRIGKLEELIDHTHQKLERLQVNFGRFTPEEVIEHLLEPDGTYKPNMRSVTVLFADLKGFTKMCAEMDPEDVVLLLNGYFRRMSDALSRHHGQVTEMMGDGLLALFGALRANPWQVQDAVNGALAMRKELELYNIELREMGRPELTFGIGIHKGEVLAGVMGNMELSKFGVVGDPINVAARVESLTRTHDVDLLITESVREALDERFVLKEMPPMEVKGKDNPIRTYYVEGVKETSQV